MGAGAVCWPATSAATGIKSVLRACVSIARVSEVLPIALNHKRHSSTSEAARKSGSCEMRLKHGLAMVVVSILSLGIGFPSAHALSSWDCAGWTVKLTNTCDNVLVYFHVCYGRNGEFGTDNFNVPPMGGHQIHVQQFSTFISSCGVIPSFICPGGMGPLPLDHCD